MELGRIGWEPHTNTKLTQQAQTQHTAYPNKCNKPVPLNSCSEVAVAMFVFNKIKQLQNGIMCDVVPKQCMLELVGNYRFLTPPSDHFPSTGCPTREIMPLEPNKTKTAYMGTHKTITMHGSSPIHCYTNALSTTQATPLLQNSMPHNLNPTQKKSTWCLSLLWRMISICLPERISKLLELQAVSGVSVPGRDQLLWEANGWLITVTLDRFTQHTNLPQKNITS